jgi:spore germination protein GerM
LQPETVRINPAGDPIAQTLEQLFATTEGGGPSAFPQGTRLLSLKVETGVATLDLGSEFRKINVMGDTGESLAQNALRQALAQFPEVQKMTVLVEGKPFEGEHSGAWVEIPVRDANTRASSSP